jgi:hypothetical protein
MVSSCRRCNEASDSLKFGEFLDSLSVVCAFQKGLCCLELVSLFVCLQRQRVVSCAGLDFE